MKISLSMLAAAGALAVALLGSAPVKADLVYDNGPINANINAWTLNFGFVVTDSFVVSSPTTLTSAQIGLWMFPGDTPTSVDWAIGTSQYGSDISAGTGALTNVFQFNNSYGFDIYQSDFALTGALTPGTYYLTLQNLAVSSGNPGYWDENDGPSAAFENSVGPIGSESFRLYGSASDVPEPGTYALIGSLGLTGAAFLRRRRAC